MGCGGRALLLGHRCLVHNYARCFVHFVRVALANVCVLYAGRLCGWRLVARGAFCGLQGPLHRMTQLRQAERRLGWGSALWTRQVVALSFCVCGDGCRGVVSNAAAAP